jgi:hypothetical protein
VSYPIIAGAAIFCALINRTVDLKSIERQCINGLIIIIVGTIMNFKPHQNRFVIVQRIACSKTDLRWTSEVWCRLYVSDHVQGGFSGPCYSIGFMNVVRH